LFFLIDFIIVILLYCMKKMNNFDFIVTQFFWTLIVLLWSLNFWHFRWILLIL